MVALCAAVLSGCGGSPLQPLYGKTASGQQMTDVLANLDVAIIPGRVGQRVRNELIFHRAGNGDGTSPVGAEYRLEIALREYNQAVLVTTTGLAGGAVFSLDATFKIIRVKDSKVVFTANAYARAPFETNRVTDPLDEKGNSTGRSVFANVRAANDAQNRAANSIAGDIRTRVAAYLSGAA
jgi:LPS-assembly lipoprotein